MANERAHLVTPLLIIVVGLLLTRLFAMYGLPLFDTTEARYAEIARIMFETNNWITPQFDYNVPFWGKPPFHTWLSATGFTLVGVSEFSARLPHFLCGLMVIVLVFHFCRQHLSLYAALVAVLALVSSLGFIVSMGMVMTDTALLLTITLAMLSYWKAFAQGDRYFHGHLFFVSLALGMLVKGPVAIVLVGIALLLWALSTRNLKRAFTALPWISGTLLFVTLAVPWYWLAEVKTPGFLEYFLLGEHFQRFVVSGWEGDLYGTAHDKPRGTIWLYWLVTAFPWSFLLIGGGMWKVISSATRSSGHPLLTRYLVCFMLAPMMLFTLSGNILTAYVLPGFSAMAILIAQQFTLNKRLLSGAVVTWVLLISVLLAYYQGAFNKTSEERLLTSKHFDFKHIPLYYWQERPFSARFYSNGTARLLETSDALQQVISSEPAFYLASAPIAAEKLKQQTKNLNCREENHTNTRVLWLCEVKR